MIEKKITIIDYGIGNILSNVNAIKKFGIDPVVSSDHEEIKNSDAIILPGVGSFEAGMNNLQKNKLTEVIKIFAETGKPILGICLGMQLLFTYSEEGGLNKGLNIIPGEVKKFKEQEGLKIPTIEWKNLTFSKSDKLITGLHDKNEFYFVHSYFCTPSNPDNILAKAKFGDFEYCAIANKNNIYGCQFHPEKSRSEGLQIIENFIKII